VVGLLQVESEVGKWPTDRWKDWTKAAVCPCYDGHDDQVQYSKYKMPATFWSVQHCSWAVFHSTSSLRMMPSHHPHLASIDTFCFLRKCSCSFVDNGHYDNLLVSAVGLCHTFSNSFISSFDTKINNVSIAHSFFGKILFANIARFLWHM